MIKNFLYLIPFLLIIILVSYFSMQKQPNLKAELKQEFSVYLQCGNDEYGSNTNFETESDCISEKYLGFMGLYVECYKNNEIKAMVEPNALEKTDSESLEKNLDALSDGAKLCLKNRLEEENYKSLQADLKKLNK